MCALLITHLSQGLLVGTPLIGIFIWSLPLIIFGFIILIYFMSACLIVFGLPDASLLSWLELIEIVALFLVAVYAAREQLNVK